MRDSSFDLGRLYEKLDTICKHPIFDKFELFSKHHEIDTWLETQSEEKQDEFFHDLRWWVRDIEEKVLECWSIAAGNDEFNWRDDDSLD